MITLSEAKAWLRIDLDYTLDDEPVIKPLIATSIATIKVATGVPKDFITKIKPESIDEIKDLYLMAQRILLTDLYNERDTENLALLSYYIQLELAYRGCLLIET